MTDTPNSKRAWRLLVPLVGLALTGCAWPLSGGDSGPELNSKAWLEGRYERAKGMLAEGHYGLALENFRDVLRYDRYSVKVLNGLAASYDKLGRFDLAQRYYKEALIVEPMSFQTLNNIGYSYLLSGRIEDAREFLGKAAAIDGSNATIVANLKKLVSHEVEALSKNGSKTASETDTAQRGTPAAGAAKSKDTGSEPGMWVERSSSSVQALITRPDSALVEWAKSNGIAPRWVHTENPPSTKPAATIAVVTKRDPVLTLEQPSAQTSSAKRTPGVAAGPAMTAVAAPVVSGPHALSAPGVISKDAAEDAAKDAAKDAANSAPGVISKDAAEDAAADKGGAADEGSATLPPKSVAGPAAPVAPAQSASDRKAVGTDDTAEARRGAQVSPVQERPVVAGPTDAKPPAPAPAKTAKESVASASAQSLFVPHAIYGGKMKAGANADAAESPRQERVAPVAEVDTEVDAAVAPGPEAANRLPQVTASQKVPLNSQITTAAPAKTVTTSTQAAKSSEAQAVPVAIEADHKEYGPRQDGAKPRVLEISNGAGRLSMAARMEDHLQKLDIPVINLTNATSFTNNKTVLYFKPGFEAMAMRVSLMLPLPPDLRRDPALQPDLRLVLGADILDFDRQLLARQLVAQVVP